MDSTQHNQTHNTYNDACRACRLYEKSSYYKANLLQAFGHLTPEQYGGKFVLVVTGSPESHGDYHPPESKAGQFVFDILKRLQVPYAVTSSIKCDPTAIYDKKAELKVAHQCCSLFAWNDVWSLYNAGKLGCIVCLGSNPMNTILPDMKLRVDQAKHGLHWIGPAENQIPVLVTNAPNVHFQDYNDGGKDLRPEYISVFGLANRIATGQYQKPNFNVEYLKTQTWEEIDTWLKLNPDYFQATHVVFDVESNINTNIQDRCTVFHPATKILCFTIRFKDQQGNKRIIVVRTRDLDKPTCYQWIKYLLLGCGVPKIPGGSNILFDMCHVLSCALPLTIDEPLNFFALLPGLHDYFQWHFLKDQGRIGNGQKDLVLHYFREPDYSVPVRDALAALKKSGIQHPDYGDLQPDFLEQYCGLDGAWGGELLDLVLEQMEDEEHDMYVPYMAKMDEIRGATLSSLLGIPVDINHFKAAQERAEAAIKQTSDWLDNHPLVKHCGYDKCNTKSTKLMSMLVELTLHYCPTLRDQMSKTPSGLWQVSDDTRPILCAAPGDVGLMWQAIDNNRAMRDFISKALSMPLKFATDIYGDGIQRIHPMWKISKSDFNQQGGEVKEGKSEGTDTSRWACLAKGTKIYTVAEDKPCPHTGEPRYYLPLKSIEDIVIGDIVVSKNEKGEQLEQKVVWAGCTGHKEVVKVQYQQTTLLCTPEHRIRLITGEWVEAQNLKRNDRLMTLHRSRSVRVDSVTWTGESVDVYDITLEGEPCFIANGVAVHNSEPNVQNIMARGDEKLVAEVRRGYIALPGYTLVNSDLKTIEPVLLAWISGSKRMKDIFLLGVHEPDNPLADYYKNLGSHFFKVVDPNITPATVTKAMRVVAKNDILLALQYGRSPNALAGVLGCTYEEADRLLKEFFYELYPEVHVAYEAVRHKVFYGEEIVTVTGTRHRFPLQQLYNYDRTVDYWTLPYELNKKLNITNHDAHMLRKAWNFVHQGPAAQINSSGLVQIHDERILDRQLANDLRGAQMSVHDALVYQMKTGRLQELVDFVVTILYDPERLDELGFNFGFTKDENPLRGEVKAGMNYFDMSEISWKRIH